MGLNTESMVETNAKTERLLDRARKLQQQFWNTLSELEAEIGFEIDSSQELPDDIEDLEWSRQKFLGL